MKIFNILFIAILSLTILGCDKPQTQEKKDEEVITVRDKEATQDGSQAGSNAVDVPHLLAAVDNERFTYAYSPIGYNNIDIEMTKDLNCIKQITKCFGYNFDIQKFYDDYFNSMNLHTDTTPVIGNFGLSGYTEFTNTYYLDNNIPIEVKEISGVDFETFTNIVNHNWPIMVWYTLDDSQFGGDIQYWPFHYPMIATKVDKENVYLFDAINGEKVESISEFQRIWEKCGNYCLVFY
jgi:hypothetical protein